MLVAFFAQYIYCVSKPVLLSPLGGSRSDPQLQEEEREKQQVFQIIWSEWRLTVIAATVRKALVDILDLSEVDIPAGVFLHPAVG